MDINKYLCQNHNDIIYNLGLIRKKLKAVGIEKEYTTLINNTIKLCRECKKQGQRMENRLSKYKNTIESLGFERIK